MWMNGFRKAVDLFPKCKGLVVLQKRDFSSEIFISRLSFYTTKDEIRQAFSRFGSIKDVRLVMDAKLKRPKGYAFVEYSMQEEAEKAVKAMNGRIYGGRLIFVQYKKPEPGEEKPEPGEEKPEPGEDGMP